MCSIKFIHVQKIILWTSISVIMIFISVSTPTSARNVIKSVKLSLNKQDKRENTLKEFDEDVALCRREMRKYCATVQQMMKESQIDKVKKQEARKHLYRAHCQWESIRTTYQNNPPQEYAEDNKFKGRLADIANAMKDMKKNLMTGQAKKSFQACAFACGLFVKMHEENGLSYALDHIYHLRKVAKAVIAAGKIGGTEAVKGFLPKLLFLRNQVILAPCPFPEDSARCNEFYRAVGELSSMLDDLASSIIKKNDGETVNILNNLLNAVSKPYGLAL